jgi:predicted ATPase with chaperone activity
MFLPTTLSGFTVLGELGLDGSIAPVAGALAASPPSGRPQFISDMPWFG